MTVAFTSNFLSNSRGVTFLDGGGITWTFNKNTNAITATGAGGAGIGTVTSVGLTSTDFTVSGSPITSSGNITANLAVQAGVTPASYTYASLTVNSKGVITAVSSGTQPVTSIGSSNLSIGGSTAVPTVNLSSTQVTNIGLGATALQSASVIDSISGNGTGGSPLQLVGDALTPGNNFYYGTNGSGTRGWYANATIPAAANPTASVGLAAVNGSAATFMRSDGAPPISSAIYTTGTFTATLLGCTTSPTATFDYLKLGNIVILTLRVLSGTSNANTLGFSGLPAAIQTSVAATPIMSNRGVLNNGANPAVDIEGLILPGSGTLSLSFNTNDTGWTTSGSKGLSANQTITYPLS